MRLDEIKENRMYDEFAHLWPLISAPADYAEEARHWRDILRDKLGEGRHHILELGVGGGNNLSHLTSEYEATAVDISEKMLENSRKLNPGVEHIVGDMRTIRLERTFDAVLIHDAINYMRSEDDLKATFATAAVHLRPGGVFVIAPDYTTETFTDGTVHHDSSSLGDIHLKFIECDFDPDPNDTEATSLMVYLIREKGRVRVELDRHVFGLFSDTTWMQLIEEAGFAVVKASYDVHEDKRQAWLYVGVKL